MSEELENRKTYPMFFKLWDLQCEKMESLKNGTYRDVDRPRNWDDFEIYAHTKDSLSLFSLSGFEDYCLKGTKVRIWAIVA